MNNYTANDMYDNEVVKKKSKGNNRQNVVIARS